MANTWKNADGLYVKFGTAAAALSEAGEYHFDGGQHLIEIKIPDMTAVGSTSTILDDAFRTGQNWRIDEVKVITDTVCTGSGAVLNVGIVKSDRSTAVDADGLIAALPVTSMDAAGETTILTAGSTYAGALIGTSLTSTSASGYIVADYDTAAFTAGAIRILIKYSLLTS